MNLISLHQPTGCPARIQGCDREGECPGVCIREHVTTFWQDTPAATTLAAQNRIKQMHAWGTCDHRIGFALPAWVRKFVMWVRK